MPALHAKKKVEIIIDAAEADRVVALVQRCGARGYTLIRDVSGKGVRGIRTGHDIFQAAPNVLVVVIAAPDVAERIVAEVMGVLETRAGVVFVSDVQVVRDDQF